MKKNNKLIATVFAFTFGVMAIVPGIQAHATTMSSFPTQNMTTYSTRPTAGLQTFLLNYSKETKAYIRDNGMIDGQFGKATSDALKIYQKDRGIKEDGSCGRQTWTNIQAYIFTCHSYTNGSWTFYSLKAPYYESGKSLAQRTTDFLWRAYFKGEGNITNFKLGWHDIG